MAANDFGLAQLPARDAPRGRHSFDADQSRSDPKAACPLDKSLRPADHKDGVAVAKESELAEPVRKLVAQMLRRSAGTRGELAGDGTRPRDGAPQAIFA